MRYKKFLLIPLVFFLLVLGYVAFIGSLDNVATTTREVSNAGKSAGGEVIGVGQAVSVQITRATKSYLFGFVNLPVSIQGLGNLSTLHTIFFWSLYTLIIALTTTFIIIERRNVNMVKGTMVKNTMKSSPKTTFARSGIWMKLAKAIGIGALFTLVAFLISDDTASLPLGLLVAYLEFRLS